MISKLPRATAAFGLGREAGPRDRAAGLTIQRGLRASAGRPIVDRTGLTGNYEFKLVYRPGNVAPGPADERPDVFTALREQLGLTLESARGPVSVILVERIELIADDPSLGPADIAALLTTAQVGVDELIRQSGTSAGAVQLALLELEIAGRLVRHAGGRVSRKVA